MNGHSERASDAGQAGAGGVTPAQVKAARKLLGWTRDHLAEVSRVIKAAISHFERGAVSKAMTPNRLATFRTTLEAAGVEFTNGDVPGVKLRRPG